MYGTSLELLKNFGIYYWPRFSSTTKGKEVVNNKGKRVVFEILMSESTTQSGAVPTSIDLTKNSNKAKHMTDFINEKEVLLMP